MESEQNDFCRWGRAATRIETDDGARIAAHAAFMELGKMGKEEKKKKKVVRLPHSIQDG